MLDELMEFCFWILFFFVAGEVCEIWRVSELDVWKELGKAICLRGIVFWCVCKRSLLQWIRCTETGSLVCVKKIYLHCVILLRLI